MDARNRAGLEELKNKARLKRKKGFNLTEFIDWIRNGSQGVAAGRYMDNLDDTPYTNEELREAAMEITKFNSIPMKIAFGATGAVPGVVMLPANIPVGVLLALLGAGLGVKIGDKTAEYQGVTLGRDMVKDNQSRRDILNIGSGAKTLK